MTKVLLVEDDNNLREIYEARLAAEGYDISTAKDGEDALAVAKQVKPDLIISDVMMPRISGFEMLDILRNTDGLKHTKIIMLTALGQAEDKTRADSLGADRYLVKSQVTLEDIVKAAQELLDPDAAATAVPEPTTEATNTFSPIASPDVAAAAHQSGASAIQTVPAVPTVSASEPNDNPEATVTPIPDVAVQPEPMPVTPAPAQPEPAIAPPASVPTPVVDAPAPENDEQPLIQMPQQPVNAVAATATSDVAQSTSQENAAVAQQIENFVNTEQPVVQAPQPVSSPPTDVPANNTANDAVINEAIDNLATDEPAAQPATSQPDSVSSDVAVQPEPTDTPEETIEPGIGQISGKKVISPINDINAGTNDLQTLLAQEQMKEDLEKGATGTPVIGGDTSAPAVPPINPPVETNVEAKQTPLVTPPSPGGVFTPNENGNANENAL